MDRNLKIAFVHDVSELSEYDQEMTRVDHIFCLGPAHPRTSFGRAKVHLMVGAGLVRLGGVAVVWGLDDKKTAALLDGLPDPHVIVFAVGDTDEDVMSEVIQKLCAHGVDAGCWYTGAIGRMIQEIGPFEGAGIWPLDGRAVKKPKKKAKKKPKSTLVPRTGLAKIESPSTVIPMDAVKAKEVFGRAIEKLEADPLVPQSEGKLVNDENMATIAPEAELLLAESAPDLDPDDFS